MGNELKCTARIGKQQSAGRALLETSEIIFRGDFRLKIPFTAIRSVKAVDGELRVQAPDGLAVFHLGAAAEKWRDKILHPKSRMEKLGVKPGTKVSLLGGFDAEFLREIGGVTKSVIKGKVAAGSDWIFLAADSKAELSAAPKIAKSMQGAAAILRRVGLSEDAIGRYPHEFSGGQRQRIGIARALILHPRVIVADEPVSALDVSIGAQVLLLLRELQREFALTYIFISHSLPVVAQVATRIAVMRAGQFLEMGIAEQVLQQPEHEYTRELLAAVPELPRA